MIKMKFLNVKWQEKIFPNTDIMQQLEINRISPGWFLSLETTPSLTRLAVFGVERMFRSDGRPHHFINILTILITYSVTLSNISDIPIYR